jgi:uncharacterized membrane protein YfhO
MRFYQQKAREIYIILFPLIIAILTWYGLTFVTKTPLAIIGGMIVASIFYISFYIAYDAGHFIGFGQGFSYSNKNWISFLKKQFQGFAPLDEIVKEIEADEGKS